MIEKGPGALVNGVYEVASTLLTAMLDKSLGYYGFRGIALASVPFPIFFLSNSILASSLRQDWIQVQGRNND